MSFFDQGTIKVPGEAPVDAPVVPAQDPSQITPMSTLTQQFSRHPAQFYRHFWRHQMDLVEHGCDSDGKSIDFYNLGSASNGSSSALPLARIKKVMKNDDEVKMISAEAPILFSRACEIFISDLTCRAFMVAEENKRRTIQRSDIANAIARSDLFDFLIDIVPRTDMVRGRSASVPVRSNVTPMPPSFTRMVDGGPQFMPLRPSQQSRVDDEMKTMHKEIPSDWSTSPMYPLGMGDARLHPAPLGMPHAPGGAPVMPTQAPPRGSFLNMVPYSVPSEHKGDDVGE